MAGVKEKSPAMALIPLRHRRNEWGGAEGRTLPNANVARISKHKIPMTDYQRHIAAAVTRSLGIIDENPLDPANPTATALITELTAKSDAIDAVAATQDLGYGTVNGSIDERRILKARLVEMLGDLAETARVLDPIEHPGVGGEMRMRGATNSYAALATRARAFHTALVPEKDTFVGYGSPATIDVDLMAAITALEAAGERKNGGRADHVGGTAGLAILCKAALKLLQKVDVIVSKAWKDNPGLLAAWKAARRVERAPRRSGSEG